MERLLNAALSSGFLRRPGHLGFEPREGKRGLWPRDPRLEPNHRAFADETSSTLGQC